MVVAREEEGIEEAYHCFCDVIARRRFEGCRAERHCETGVVDWGAAVSARGVPGVCGVVTVQLDRGRWHC